MLENRGLLRNRCYAHSNNPGKQFLPLDSSTLLPGATLRPAPRSVRICHGYSSKCGYPQTYVRVKLYSLQSVAVGRDPSGARDHACLHCRVPRGSSNARSRNRFPSFLICVGSRATGPRSDIWPDATFRERSLAGVSRYLT